MIENHLKIALRHLFRNKAYSFINITGLAIGLACCLLIVTFVHNELSFDQFHSKKDRVYRLNKINRPKTGGTELHAIASGLMGPTIAADYPEVEQSLRVLPWFSDVLMIKDDTKLKISDVLFADANFFDFFDFKLLQGDPTTALESPQSIVLAQQTSRNLFGDRNPIGQTILGFRNVLYQVTGVIEDAPANTHLRYNALISWSSTVPGVGALNMAWMNNWITQVNYTYLLLRSKKAARSLEPKLIDFMKKYIPSREEQYELYLQPMTDIHLRSSDIQYSRNLNLGNITYVYIFSVAALLILLIACINFINLSTARATKRSREVGVRKTLGALRWQLSAQFLGESSLLTVLALAIAVVLVESFTPLFGRLTGYGFHFQPFSNSLLILGFIGIAVVLGFVAGSYPALILSRFQPDRVLRGRQQTDGRGATPRKLLVTIQFVASIVLILGTIIIYRQMHFVQTKNMGFQKEQIIVLPIGTTEISDNYQGFKEEILQYPEIQSVAGSQDVPGEGTMGFNIAPEDKPENENWQAQVYPVDFDFLATYKMKMAEGRYFSRAFATDATEGVIINQALQRSLGWRDPIGKRLDISGETHNAKVIGVIEDFNFDSLRRPIDPLVLYISPQRIDNISIRITGNNVPATLQFLRGKWREFESKYPFEYYFLDKHFQRFYRSERQMMRTLTLFALLAVFIASLGLFGLASFAVEQRTKEIGIRKLLGASVPGIVSLLTTDFVRLVLVANIISWPIAWYAMNRWLQNFAYRVNIGWWMFILAGGLALLIAVLTVSTQAIKAAVANPVKALRYE